MILTLITVLTPFCLSAQTDTTTWFDQSRRRAVPVAFYGFGNNTARQLVILSPGYPGKNTDYAYIATNMVKQGYRVVVVQHDLPIDPPMPSGTNLYQRRLPFWENGINNILFVIRQLKKQYPLIDYKHLILVGHFNGGDSSMLMAKRYPKMVSKVVSLDNRRVPFPRIDQLKILLQ